jgi:hypothetical protein
MHRPKPQKPEPQQISAIEPDPEALDLFARRIRAGLFAAQFGYPFDEIVLEPFVSPAERQLFRDLAAELLRCSEGCLTPTVN